MKKELVSFNAVVRDIPSLVELDDAALEHVIGGMVIGLEKDRSPDTGDGPTRRSESCNTLC